LLPPPACPDHRRHGPEAGGCGSRDRHGRRGTDLARETADLVLTDDAFATIEVAVEGGRTIGSQLRRAVAFYLGAKLALVSAMLLLPLALGLPAPFRPAHIGPRRARRHLLTGTAPAVAVLLAFFLARRGGVHYGSAAAVATWLLGHVGVAWTLRARPRLALRDNVFFPLWGAAAAAVAVLLAASPLGTELGLATLPAAICPGGGVRAARPGLAAVAERATGLGRRL
jgi:P-type Ca2+ transporter type 2C